MQPTMTAARLDSFAAAWSRCDLDALSRFLTADAVYSPLGGHLVRGRDEVLRRFAEGFARDDASQIEFEPARVSGDVGTCRWRLSGRTAAGASYTVERVDLYEFAGDLIRVKDRLSEGMTAA